MGLDLLYIIDDPREEISPRRGFIYQDDREAIL